MSPRRSVSLAVAFVTLLVLLPASYGVKEKKFVYVMKLKADYIGPPTVSQVDRIITASEKDGAAAAVLMLDTPGGSVDSMFEIIKRIYSSTVPVIVYVAPKGANAASAGAFITVASHIAAMAPGTAIGAAEPIIGYGGTGTIQPAPNKTKSFIIGKMQATANFTGRPVDVCVEFITRNLVLTPDEALREGVVDFVADNLDELLSKIENFQIHGTLPDGSRPNITLSDAEARYIELTLPEKFTNYMSNPTVAYILLMIGMYGLIFGFLSPGTYIPETIGAICIILSLYGLGIVGASLVGILLIVLGMIFLVAEAATPTFGLFTTASVICFVFGILFIPPRGGGQMPTFYMPREWYRTFTITALALVAGFVSFFVVGLRFVFKARKKPVVTGGSEMIGMRGRTITKLDPKGQVRVRGEIWMARSISGTIPSKAEVEVVDRDGLVLLVRPAQEEGPPD